MLIWSTLVSGQIPKKRFKLPSDLNEVSGLYYAQTDSLWWHNDSGHPPQLLLTDGRGTLRKKITLPQASNKDWEDLTSDPAGWIYIGDFGNNNQPRTSFTIYKYHPELGKLDSIRYQYASKNPDVEALIWHKQHLYLFTKPPLFSKNTWAYLYQLKDDEPQQTAQLIDSVYLKKRWITGAAISPDQNKLALISYRYYKWLGIFPMATSTIWVWSSFIPNHPFATQPRKKTVAKWISKQYESIDFISPDHVLIGAEKTLFFRPKVRRIRLPRFKPTHK